MMNDAFFAVMSVIHFRFWGYSGHRVESAFSFTCAPSALRGHFFISCLTRCTVPLPTPSSRATLRHASPPYERFQMRKHCAG